MDILTEGKRVFNIEIEALEKTRDALNDTYIQIIDIIINCKGKIILTGMGKPGHIAAKLAATFASLGTPAFRLHPAEALHGDLGMISSGDVVIAISHSGESDEILRIIPNIKLIGAKLIGITGNGESSLARICDLVQVFPDFNEACHLGLAPTSSTTASLVYGDSLAVVASLVNGFKDTDFGRFHPAGSLGKKLLLKVEDLMIAYDEAPTVMEDMKLVDAISEMSKSVPGMVAVVDDYKQIKGIITDGDLRRLLHRHVDIYTMNVKDTMTKSPIITSVGTMAVEALDIMKRRSITNMPVVDNGRLIGIVDVQSILKAGIVT